MSKSKISKKNRKFNHPCTVESLEDRLLLSVAPADVDALQVGSLYIEGTFGSDQLTDDSYGDYLEISYNGGVEGTNLDKLEINLDKNSNNQVDINEAFFHLAPGNPEYGAYNSVQFEIVDANGTIKTGDVKWTISNNNQLLTMEFEDFESGDKLVCRFDVDFYKGVSPIFDEDGDIIDYKESSNVTVNGDDFEGSRIKAYFSANNYEDVSIEKTYVDNYGSVKYGLDLDENAYFPSDVISAEEYVAGAFGSIVQTPIVNSVSGFVYDDIDGSLTLTPADELLSNVTLSLYELDSAGNYVFTGLTTTTDENGFYEFTDLFNGTYMVLETQPEDYTAVCANAGYVPLTTQVSTVRDLNCIYKIELNGNQDSIQNNFGQNSPGQLSGIVWLDINLNDLYDADVDTLLKDVTVNLYDEDGDLLATTKTDSNGYYEFTDLRPGLYTVEEEWPTEYIHSGEIPGTTGGWVDSEELPGFIYDIVITSRGISESNNFWEILPGMISGYVFEDNQSITRNPDGTLPDQYKITTGVKTPDSVPIPGVTLGLYNIDGTVAITDALGNPLTTTTDENGYYEFTHLMPGSYCVIETQPKDYIDGLDTAGSGGGWAFNPTDAEYEVTVKQFGTDRNNDAIIRISVKSGENSMSNNFAEVNVDEDVTPPPPSREKIPSVRYPHNSNSSGGGFQSIPYIPSYMSHGISALYGGGGSSVSAWHLCSLNAGMTRRLGDGVLLKGLQGDGLTTDMMSASGLIANGLVKDGYGMEALINMFSPIFDPINWNGRTDAELAWNMSDWRDGTVTFVGEYGVMEGKPLTGDFNGDGKDELAVFVDGVWFIDINGNGYWDADDLWVQLGERGDQPVVGDWDGDGKADIGVYGKIWSGDWNLVENDPGLPDAENLTRGVYKNMRPKVAVKTAASGFSKLTSSGAIYERAVDHVFYFGNQGDQAITGDWNGDGVDNIGVYNNGNWYLDVDGNGRLTTADRSHAFGETGDIPVTGDWNGDGITNIGVYRNGKFILDTNGNGVMDSSDAVVESGQAGDIPIAGDFNGDGVDEVGTVKLSNVRP